MGIQARTKGRKKAGLFTALTALVLVGVALAAAGLASALHDDPPRGLQATPYEIHFGDQEVGRRSAARTVTVTNHGGQPNIHSIRIEGENADDFAITDASTCAIGPFEKGASCTIVVRFTPAEQGDRAAEISVMGIASGTPVWLWGTGRTP